MPRWPFDGVGGRTIGPVEVPAGSRSPGWSSGCGPTSKKAAASTGSPTPRCSTNTWKFSPSSPATSAAPGRSSVRTSASSPSRRNRTSSRATSPRRPTRSSSTPASAARALPGQGGEDLRLPPRIVGFEDAVLPAARARRVGTRGVGRRAVSPFDFSGARKLPDPSGLSGLKLRLGEPNRPASCALRTPRPAVHSHWVCTARDVGNAGPTRRSIIMASALASTKLTLRLPESLIEKAKTFSQQTGKSVSQIVADYFRRCRRWNPGASPSPCRPSSPALRPAERSAGRREDYHRTRAEIP